METKRTKLKETYLSPKVDILELKSEGTVCVTSDQSGTGEDYEWDS
ncbi:MAG: hypothetical protein IKW90_17540 [Lachnospiraceae bacterium]|nr:hypothetical protein [Lachnospiraceae bacterium]